MLTVPDLMAQAAAFDGLQPRHLRLIAACGGLARFPAGTMICREGERADRFFALRGGRVTLQVGEPERGSIIIQTLGPGDMLGWSWLFPPYRWQLDAMATEPVAAIAFDGACLRERCTQDHELGYQLMRRFSELMLSRLIGTRRQLLDVYGHGSR